MKALKIVLAGGVAAAALAAAAPAAAQNVTVQVQPAHAVVEAGRGVTFTAVARDAQGRAVPGVHIHWLATPFDIAGADTAGRVTTFRPGQVYVLAIPVAGDAPVGAPGVGVLDITERGPASLEIRAPEGRATIVGGTLQLQAMALTEIGDPVRTPPIAWRSLQPAIADVTAGIVRGRAPGTAFIVAELGALSTSVQVEVRANPVTTLELAPVVQPVRTGDVVALQARALGQGGTLQPIPIRWSISGVGASVDPDGRFVAERAGIFTIMAAAGGRTASAVIEAVPRVDARRVELVSHVPFPAGVQAGEIWPIGDVAYVSSIAGAVYVYDIADPSKPEHLFSLTGMPLVPWGHTFTPSPDGSF